MYPSLTPFFAAWLLPLPIYHAFPLFTSYHYDYTSDPLLDGRGSLRAHQSLGCDPKTEDTITLLVDWQNISNPAQRGTAVYTASWAAPLKAGVHSEQRFHYMAAKGEVRVDQAHRGYSVVEDDIGKVGASFSLTQLPLYPFSPMYVAD
jgi:hypothetical protein